MFGKGRRLAPDFNLKRLGTIMEPKAGDPHEVEGVLNPAAMSGSGRSALPLSASSGARQLLSDRNRARAVRPQRRSDGMSSAWASH